MLPPPLAGGGKGEGEILSVDRARELRRNLTEAERKLWRRLRLRQIEGLKFRRQHPLGHYVVDFICLEKRMIIELDGGQHLEQVEYDSRRTQWLEAQGFCLLRFWNHDVLTDIESVLLAIVDALASPPPRPSPVKGEGVCSDGGSVC